MQYQLLRDAASGQADLFAMTPGLQLSLSDDSGGFSENLRAEAISGEGFQILGIRPALGRLIQPDDDSPANANPVAVISYGFWKRHFGGSPTAIGEQLNMGRQSFQIIGVAAAPFAGVEPGYLIDVWLPLSVAGNPRSLADPDGGGIRVWGRVDPEANRPQLRERLQAVLTNFLRERVRINPPRNLALVILLGLGERSQFHIPCRFERRSCESVVGIEAKKTAAGEFRFVLGAIQLEPAQPVGFIPPGTASPDVR